ncbi:hypothetical protein Hdeb2414_s0586g00920111 [Helianthus debilis subsp. tardiflorus]
MSSSESGLSDEHDPMAIVSDDEIAHDPEVFTSDKESDPEILSEDEDDFQLFALPDFGDDIPDADDILINDVFALPALVHEHLFIGHPDGEHIVAPILDVVPLVVIPPEDWPFDDIFNDDVDLLWAITLQGSMVTGRWMTLLRWTYPLQFCQLLTSLRILVFILFQTPLSM